MSDFIRGEINREFLHWPVLSMGKNYLRTVCKSISCSFLFKMLFLGVKFLVNLSTNLLINLLVFTLKYLTFTFLVGKMRI